MWVLGLYKLSWPANGSFVYVDIFYCFFVVVVVVVVFLRGEGRNVKSERGSWGRGRRGYIVLCIHEQKTLVIVLEGWWRRGL